MSVGAKKVFRLSETEPLALSELIAAAGGDIKKIRFVCPHHLKMTFEHRDGGVIAIVVRDKVKDGER